MVSDLIVHLNHSKIKQYSLSNWIENHNRLQTIKLTLDFVIYDFLKMLHRVRVLCMCANYKQMHLAFKTMKQFNLIHNNISTLWVRRNKTQGRTQLYTSLKTIKRDLPIQVQGSYDSLRGNLFPLHNSNSSNTSEKDTWPTEQTYKELMKHCSSTVLGFVVLCLQIMMRISEISTKF